MSYNNVPPYSVALRAHVPLPHITSHFDQPSSLFDPDFIQFFNCSDVPTPPTEEYVVFTSQVDFMDRTFSQYRLDLDEIKLKTDDFFPSSVDLHPGYPVKAFCPTDEAPRGILVSEYNLHQWAEGSTAESNVGFAYNGRVKCPFAIPYDYCITSPVTLGDEKILLPFSIRIWRRDPFLTLREIRLFIQQNRQFYLPSRYCTTKEPFTLSTFQKLCRPFKVDERGTLIHKATGFEVVMGSASTIYEQGITHVFNLYGQYWHHLTPFRLNGMVTDYLKRWVVDGEFLAEYWLERLLRSSD
ncbi:hypothetical protein AAF712_002554 [Marasmius tenuissimus]|uniref:Uncharacterized protein n=1 Tax=Marasmius tenuissimus TaxID=585030 RepID=A0ABR3AAG8_9AGAR